MMIRCVPLLMLGVLSVFSVAVEAAGPLGSDEGFSQVRQQVLAELAPGKRYGEIGAADRQRVQHLLERMQVQLGEHDSAAALDAAGQARFFTDQEEVNTLLTSAAEDSRKVCERRAGTGSRFGRTVCTTVAQRRQQRDAAREILRDPLHSTGGELP